MPLIIYQGLGGNHRYNSDRHHAFILRGAADASAEFARAGLRHVFWLPRDPAEPSPLPGLAARAAAVITEDFPAPPFPAWTEALAARSATPMIGVDAACVVPMRLVEGTHDRAFRFRDAAKAHFRARATRAYPSTDADLPDASGVDLGFEPLDLTDPDIPECCAACAIDHAVAPVAHTRGGSRAGYARWEAFKRDGLGRYHKRRNNAALERDTRAVSRMSPYLHHGHVSPFRLVREASAMLGGPDDEGAAKFIDELWLWREFSHHFALTHAHELESTSVLPSWARRTLDAHASDPRTILDRETLARGRTGDALWDAAQRSLLAHGELHNNLRMTWGKALLRWHAGADATLATLIELNHRYALDGSDPNSYAGLLWCLGALDRPFDQDEPIFGSVRTRPTDAHAQRMDLDRYSAHVREPAWGTPTRVAVIGAGISGLAAARTLADHNAEVEVFDKGRGPGGRASTRFRDAMSFDHGGQYFTARDPRFTRAVGAWIDQGIVAPWNPALATIERPGVVEPKPSRETRFVGVPGMNAIATHLMDTLGDRATAHPRTRIDAIAHDEDGWRLTLEDGSVSGPFGALVLAMPPSQAAQLLPAQHAFGTLTGRVSMQPCMATMAAFDAPLPIEPDGIFVNTDASTLSWAARDSSKPGRPEGERWVLHAAPEWSRRHLDTDRDTIAEMMIDAFRDATGVEIPDPAFVGRAPVGRRAGRERRIGARALRPGDEPRARGRLARGRADRGRVPQRRRRGGAAPGRARRARVIPEMRRAGPGIWSRGGRM